MSDMDTEGEGNPNPKKRKSGPVLEPPSSEDEDEPAEDQALVENLIQANTEALARSQELELIVQNQEAKFRLLARAGQIPESEIDNLLLAQELTAEQIMEAQGESIPSVASGSGPSGSSRSGTTTIDPKQHKRSGKQTSSSDKAKAEDKNDKNVKKGSSKTSKPRTSPKSGVKTPPPV